MPNGRCRMHGGKSPGGAGHYAMTHGRYSRRLPERLASRHAEAKADTELAALRDEIALVDARLSDLLSRVDTGEAGALWREARAALAGYRESADEAERGRLIGRLGEAIGVGVLDYKAWDEVMRLVERRRRLASTEMKRLAWMQKNMTAEQAMVWLGAVVMVIRENVTDREALARISDGLSRLSIAERR